MKVYTTLLKKLLVKSVWQSISQLKIEEYNSKIESEAVSILSEIQRILMDEADDFEKVENIVLLFERYGLDCGGCHDFS